MTRLRKKLLIASLALHFAFLATGSVVLHQVTGRQDCQCLDHRYHQDLTVAECDCPNHGSRPTTYLLDGLTQNQPVNSCPIGSFYQQRIQVCQDFDSSIRCDEVDEWFESLRCESPASVAVSHPARGPPVGC